MNLRRTNTLVIKTPEGIAFPLVLAGPVTRFLAWLVDLLLITAISMIAGMIFGAFSVVSWDLAGAIATISFFLISVGYPILTEWYWRGQTVGKRVLRLRVTDAQGLRLQFHQVFIRNLMRFLDSLPVFYIVGGITCFLTRRAQRLGDLAANTIVIRHPQISEPDLAQLLSGKYNSFRDYPHLTARLRQRISTEEAGVVLQAILRRDQLDASARLELFRKISSHLITVVEFPQDATEGLTDEQYVRNVADILFERGGSTHSLFVVGPRS